MKKLWNLYTDYFGKTILHPQYIINTLNNEAIVEAKKRAKGMLIDIGCGRMTYRSVLEPQVERYVTVDKPGVANLYNPKQLPEIYADVHNLPLKDNSFNTALLLEVIEYLHTPSQALREIYRILKKNGVLIISSPFLYPIHDGEYDRNRFTKAQIKYLLEQAGFKVLKLESQGDFPGFWLQSMLVYLFKKVQKNTIVALVSLPFLLVLVLLTNLLYSIINLVPDEKESDFPLNILAVAKKK